MRAGHSHAPLLARKAARHLGRGQRKRPVGHGHRDFGLPGGLAEGTRATRHKVDALLHAFEQKTGALVGMVSSAAATMRTTAQALTGTTNETTESVVSVAAAVEQASVNLQTVASAAEELSTSVGEIARHVEQSSIAVGRVPKTLGAPTKSLSPWPVGAADHWHRGRTDQQALPGRPTFWRLNATIEAARAGDAGKDLPSSPRR